MGKDLKGKELGVGISQRADGNYMARYVDRYKKRHTFYGRDLRALRRRLEKERYEIISAYSGTEALLLIEKNFL